MLGEKPLFARIAHPCNELMRVNSTQSHCESHDFGRNAPRPNRGSVATFPRVETTPVIVLVGFMGSGKTTVGRRLAHELDVPFADLDALIEEESGLAVRDWFAQRGEPAFRAAERAALSRAWGRFAARGGVIALGGGAFEDERTRTLLAGLARTIWLDAPLDAIFSRVSGDGTRPLFGDADAVRRLFAKRSASYARADLRVDAGGPVAEVVARVQAALRRT